MQLPIAFIRRDDGERFSLNKDGKTYSLDSFRKDFPDSHYWKWTYKQLNNDNYFRAIYK